MREIDEIFIPLKKSHSGNVQQNVDDVVVLAVSFSRSDDPTPQVTTPLRDAHVQRTNDFAFPVQRDMVEW
jgi:hypothetical protein